MNKPDAVLTMRETEKWMAFLNIFRGIHPRIETQAIQVFLLVAQYEGRAQHQIADMLGTTQASVSRNLALLANYNDNSMGLVALRESPEDRRHKEIHLTSKGRMILQQIKAIS